MCKRCSRYLDLHDYRINNAVAKNFKTKGRFIVEPKGYVFNTETVAGEVVIKGKFHGRLSAERSLTIYSTAGIKGSLTAAHLIIPAENHFRWPEVIAIGSAEIAGDVAGFAVWQFGRMAAALAVLGLVSLFPLAGSFTNRFGGNCR